MSGPLPPEPGARPEQPPTNFYLAREGVAFGPYTEFQLRECVRLGIFVGADLALAENSKDWVAVSELFPADAREAAEAREKKERATAEGVPSAPPASALPPPATEKDASPALPVLTLPPSPTAEAVRPGFSARRKLAMAAVLIVALLIVGVIWTIPPPTQRVTALPQATPAPRPSPPFVARVDTQPIEPAAPDKVAPTPEQTPLGMVSPAATAAEATPAEQPASSPPVVPAQTATTRRIEGQIVVAANNGMEYQPAAVEVRLFPLAQLKPALEKRNSEANARFVELKTQIAAAEAEKELLRKTADAAFDAYVQANADNRRALEQASADAKRAREKATNVYYDLLQSREELLSGAFYLEGLPPSLDTTRTDAQGRFNFEVPGDGEFAVVAGTQRGGDEATERYYWFVPVSINGEAHKTVVLSNNNVSSHGSADSLVQTAD